MSCMADKLKLKAIKIGNLIVENETEIMWDHILEAFDFDVILEENQRLIRSQYFHDEDYVDNVINVLDTALRIDKKEACEMVEYILDNYTTVNKIQIEEVINDITQWEDYSIKSKTADENINSLIANINDSINKGEPVFALDRLHTLMHNYVKELCSRHDIAFEDKDKLDSIFKQYVKFISEYIDSQMTITILKSSISLFSQFNQVRNNYSFAHDNDVLNEAESKLIFKQIVNIKEFIDTTENEITIDSA
ncbi:MAG: hypothetical protein E7Z81_04140 [Methanobrevibacter sp.]|uniref:abortive infection family protein n=1 Tax=Methanobrevibacter sp. TaxID=66852 RepID=UPI0025E29471|nr:abortive infection family protein [Methanobrevibacter sp.]MBE6497450.1 hypothetical protein [Methanobrevibacter sp.]